MISGNMEKKAALLALSALSHDVRLDIFRLLVTEEPDGLVAGDIAAALDMKANTLSANLAILSQAGLIYGVREGRQIRYRSELSTMAGLLCFLTEDCCKGDPTVCAPLVGDRKC
jgi:ArsR family transcriptional regulator, arsenate/arsenite/antimonite-responsive transcriptional repressor